MVFEYSYWWLLPAILLSLTVAWFKFRKLSGLPDIHKGMVWIISGLRFLILFILLLLLLSPALSLLHRIKEKPLLIVAQDNSLSVLKTKDSLYYAGQYRESLKRFVEQLQVKFDVVQLAFGSAVNRNAEVDFSETRTNIAGVMEYAGQNFIGRQPKGMILLTDGIYNEGINPVYKIPAFPVFTVRLGDTTSYPDVYIRNLEADKFNFLNTIFPLKAEVAAIRQKGRQVKCILKENNRPLETKLLQIDRDHYLSEVTFEVEAKQKGVNHYSVVLETDFEERTKDNNRAESWVQIVDKSAKIAVYAGAPHPDIAAIVNALNVSGIYQCKTHRFDESPDTLQANLIILHNPQFGDPAYQDLVKTAGKRKIALWYILTDRKHIEDFSRFGRHYSVSFTTELSEYATVSMNREFPYFEFTEEEINGFATYPPLIVPFGEIDIRGGKGLFYQKVKHTSTSNGLIAFYEQEGCRIGYVWGEGLWRWRLYSYQENGNHELFNTLINKIVGYLAVQKGTERFIHDIKPVYGEMEEAVVNVELYNESYELVNLPEVVLELRHKEKVFDYILTRIGEKYRINLGNLPAGEYVFRLAANLKGEAFVKKGSFFVRNNSPELNNLVADRQLLQTIAENSGGRLFESQKLDNLVQLLREDNKLKPVYRSETEFIELSRMGVLGLILLLLLCTEWFLLKFYAG